MKGYIAKIGKKKEKPNFKACCFAYFLTKRDATFWAKSTLDSLKPFCKEQQDFLVIPINLTRCKCEDLMPENDICLKCEKLRYDAMVEHKERKNDIHDI